MSKHDVSVRDNLDYKGELTSTSLKDRANNMGAKQQCSK